MAKPAFIYTFDNLGPYRFTELCGELLGQRYNGFLLGGEGADGGIDAEIDKVLGILHPQSHTPFLNEIIQPGQTIVFQFKHKVTARVGQSQSREQLLSLYKCNKDKICELHKDLVQSKKPTSYVLVTNVEVNSLYRERFIKYCKEEDKSINNYQIIGLDELVNWIETMPDLRHLYFPTIFSILRFNLNISLSYAYPMHLSNPLSRELLAVNVLNVGTVPSYLGSAPIKLVCLIDGEQKEFRMINFYDPECMALNPPQGEALEPGKKYTYHFPTDFTEIKKLGKDIFPTEIRVEDEIGNIYTLQIDEGSRKNLIDYIYGNKK